MKKYQVTLYSGRTDTLDIYADSMLDIKSIYEGLSDADLRIIKEVEYINPSPQNKLTQFYRELKVLVSNTKENKMRYVTVRFMKPLLSKEKIISTCKQFIQIDGKNINHVVNIVKHG